MEGTNEPSSQLSFTANDEGSTHKEHQWHPQAPREDKLMRIWSGEGEIVHDEHQVRRANPEVREREGVARSEANHQRNYVLWAIVVLGTHLAVGHRHCAPALVVIDSSAPLVSNNSIQYIVF
jgi:hypothetical protein